MAELIISEGGKSRKWVHSYSMLKGCYVVGLYDLAFTQAHKDQWILRYQIEEGEEAYDIMITQIAEAQKPPEPTEEDIKFKQYMQDEFDKKSKDFLKDRGIK